MTEPGVITEDSPLIPRSARVTQNRRYLGYLLTVACCFFSASFNAFSLYTEPFADDLHYTPLEINYISIAAEIGLYFCVPFLGYIADTYSLSVLGALGSLTSLLGYTACLLVAKTHASYIYMAIAFGVVGISCSAIFICCLVHCARLYHNSATLSIAIPTTLYGLSCIFFAKVISHWLDSNTPLETVFLYLSVFLTAVGLLQAVAVKVGRAGEFATMAEIEEEHEQSNNLKRFFSDKKALLCLLSFVLVSGPLETFQNNLGLIVKTGYTNADVASQVTLFSIFSTVSRIAAGGLTDGLKWKPPIIALGVIAGLAVVDLLFALDVIPLGLTSAVSGYGYGSSFTLYPLIVSNVWGVERFATYWGLFILGPAIGTFIFGLVFALDIEYAHTYTHVFFLCALSLVASLFIHYKLQLYRIYKS